MSRFATLSSLRKKEGGDEEDDERPGGPASFYAGGAGAHGGSPAGPKADIVIKLYKNGFIVNDGPFRATSESEENQKFVRDLERGVVPRELEAGSRGKKLEVDVVDKRAEEYEVPPPPAYVAFAGSGHSLGGAGGSGGRTGASGAGGGGGGGGGVGAGGGTAAPVVAARAATVDAASPTTSVMVRLAKGTREKLTLNLTHTVRDLYAAVAALDPSVARFQLSAGYPPKPLDRASGDTIEAAGLVGSAVQQQRL